MASLFEITHYLDTYLSIRDYEDNHWNGLQIEGKQDIRNIVTAVDAGITTFQKALEVGADMIIVHHGHYFKRIPPMITGWQKKRLDILLQHNISLYGAHIPLDAHPEVGNNAQLLAILNAEKQKPFDVYGNKTISWIGTFETPRVIDDIAHTLNSALSTTCKVLPFGPKEIKTVAVTSGAGGYNSFYQALAAHVDLYISGDSVEVYQTIKDAGMNVIFAGHYASEIVGVQALGKHLEKTFGIKAEFVDVPTGL